MDEENLSVPPVVDNKWKNAFKTIKRIFYSIIITCFLVISSALVLGYYYQDEVKNYIVGELNKNLNTQIIIDGNDIEFTVLKNFPFASVEFNNVKALDAIEGADKDTLFKAKNISLQFSIIDIFEKNYRIKKIECNEVALQIRIDKKGNDNYHFWKSSKDIDTANFTFALEEIALNQIHFVYQNKQQHQEVNLLLNKGVLSGNFSKQKYSLEVMSDLFLNEANFNNGFYLRNKNVKVDAVFEVDNIQNSYSFKKGELAIEKLQFAILGSFITNDKTTVDVKIEGKEMDIQSVLSLIPTKYKKHIKDYESEGVFYFNTSIRGVLSNEKMPKISTLFGIRNANITQVSNNIVLKNVNLNGTYTNGREHNARTSELTIPSFNATLGEGNISGSLKLRDFDNLFVESKLKADISLTGLQEFVRLDTVESLSGALRLDLNVKGEWKDVYAANTEKNTTTGSLMIYNMNLKLKNNIRQFSNINGDFNFDNNNLIINDFYGMVSSSDFHLHGNFKNIVRYIFKENESLMIEATLNSKNIDLNELLENKEEVSVSENNYQLKFSEFIDANITGNVDHLVFRKFEAKNIHGNLKMKDKRMLLDPIGFSTMDGNITASGMIDGRDPSVFYVSCFADLKSINVTKLFTAFENFGQTNITDNNIRGTAFANIQFNSPVSSNLSIDVDKLLASIDMTVEKGELNNVEALKSLSKYIALDELMNVKFSTLKNTFEIKNKMVSFPQMEIRTNAINIVASGNHSFNNEINYKIKLTLDELLSQKAKRNKKENDEFGEVAEDGSGRTNIYISMTGTVDNPIIKYDKKEAMQGLKENLKTEKQTVKSILKEEFGWFKKDSTLNKQPEEKEKPNFKINWEEETSPPKEEKPKTLKPPKKKQEEEDF